MKEKPGTHCAPLWRKLVFDPVVGDFILMICIMMLPFFWQRVFSGILIFWTNYRTNKMGLTKSTWEYNPILGQNNPVSPMLEKTQDSDSAFSEAETLQLTNGQTYHHNIQEWIKSWTQNPL